jgi:1,2-dihydroxy-3-keto-5-methylthiopentene dioxygenase
MARITIPSEGRQVEAPDAVSAFLAPFGIWYERWDVGDRVDPDASQDEILRAYGVEVQRLKDRGGYVTADVINVTPELPGLDAMLERFNKEHTHDEDEVRFIVKGRGVFHIHPNDGPVFAIQLDAGDLINVPAGTRHWFDLCEERTIRAIRLFKDPSGWAPRYVDSPVHEEYVPLCWGPRYIPAQTARVAPAVRV